MKIGNAIAAIKTIVLAEDLPPVYRTAAEELSKIAEARVEAAPEASAKGIKSGMFALLSSVDSISADSTAATNHEGSNGYVYLDLNRDGSGYLATSRDCLLYGFVDYMVNGLAEEDIELVEKGKSFEPAFSWQRSTYDFFLNQEGRIQRGIDTEAYIRRLACFGFTHLEVNGLAFPMSLETGPKGEAYPMFYTYCPALDQFVYSSLNKGLYPNYYLAANLSNLKQNAMLAGKYGLVPGLLCFEPRSVPEQFFARYPMLRGARVDHPFRSFKPRYNMTIANPSVREHYAEMMTKLMDEVPELGFISIWTNDSGAGFEHTKSLYVGRNGGAYLIREWKDDEEIARLAGENALRFLGVLRDAAMKVNPGFRVLTRMESFYGEHEVIWKGLENQLDVETASLIGRGWEMPYTHPRYLDSKSINAGTVYQDKFDEKEKMFMKELESKSSRPHYYFASGPNSIFAPLLGIPYPTLTYRRLKMLHGNGVRFLSHHCGTFPPELVQFNVNHEIVKRFQFNSEMDNELELKAIATKWAGQKLSKKLLKAWELTEDAILAFPNITPLYSTFGFVWYRLWVRPFVPNLEAIPDEDRAYYEDFMCTTPHNPNNVDLSRDVLFQLTTTDKCRKDLERIDGNLWEPLDEAISLLEAVRNDAAKELGERNIIEDQFVRLSALKCWFMTQRNVAAWVSGVYGYMEAETEVEKKKNRDLIREMMRMEIENSRILDQLLDIGMEFMATTDIGETPLMHGDNLRELLAKRISLMQRHMDDEPYIDPNYIEKKAGKVME